MTTDLVPDDYAATLENLKEHVHTTRLRVQRKANNELLQLWWQIGQVIRARRSQEAWGTNVLAAREGSPRGVPYNERLLARESAVHASLRGGMAGS